MQIDYLCLNRKEGRYMSRLRLKRILTLAYSAVITALFCILAYLVSVRISFDLKETFFLIGLVFVLVGIVIIIVRNQNRTGFSNFSNPNNEDSEVTEDNKSTFMLGFNSFTPVMVGVLLLIVDAIIR